jgi:XTP/dITP diphosphohydrolase
MKVLFASNNKGKQKEAAILLADLDVELVFPQDIPELENFDVDETGKTFAENALLKAEAFANKTSLPCIADDSGIIIDALNGPGVNSNRWFPGNGDDRNNEVLRLLKDEDNRTARYTTCICYFDPKINEPSFFEAHQEGEIGHEIVGSEGFDYDRIFIPEGYDKTFAQLGDDIKNQNSQRTRALKKLSTYLKEQI